MPRYIETSPGIWAPDSTSDLGASLARTIAADRQAGVRIPLRAWARMRWRRDPRRRDEWAHPYTAAARGFGDCEECSRMAAAVPGLRAEIMTARMSPSLLHTWPRIAGLDLDLSGLQELASKVEMGSTLSPQMGSWLRRVRRHAARAVKRRLIPAAIAQAAPWWPLVARLLSDQAVAPEKL